MRGPMALPNHWTGRPVRVVRRSDDREFFQQALTAAIAQIAKSCPQALEGITVTMQEVPDLPAAWRHHSVPLAAAVESPDGRAAQVVVYRRPLELRAASREGLRILVLRTLVEQLAVVTGLTPDEISPEGLDPDA